MSAADLLVFVGALVALFHVRWNEAPYLRQFMVGIVWFQAVLVLVVVAHPFRDNIVEWFHRWSYLGGSVIVGWVIATYGRTRQAFRLFLAGSSILAVIAMEHAVTLHFQPAQWGVYQKNGIGAIMWIAIVVAQINPSVGGDRPDRGPGQQVPLHRRPAGVAVAPVGHPAHPGHRPVLRS